MRAGAFFDMDKTLIAENSGSLYLRHRYALGETDERDLARGAFAYLQYKMGVLDVRSFVQEISRDLAGKVESSLFREARTFVKGRVVPTLYPEALEEIAKHRAQGRLLAIVSGATKFVVRPLADHLRIDHALHTQLEVSEGRLTGRVIDPVCFEDGKIYWLRRFADEQGVDLARSWFYSDSITDLPLLDLVAHPVVVNPDPWLYRIARRRYWPIRYFEQP